MNSYLRVIIVVFILLITTRVKSQEHSSLCFSLKFGILGNEHLIGREFLHFGAEFGKIRDDFRVGFNSYLSYTLDDYTNSQGSIISDKNKVNVFNAGLGFIMGNINKYHERYSNTTPLFGGYVGMGLCVFVYHTPKVKIDISKTITHIDTLTIDEGTFFKPGLNINLCGLINLSKKLAFVLEGSFAATFAGSDKNGYSVGFWVLRTGFLLTPSFK